MKIEPFEWIFRERTETMLNKLANILATNNSIKHDDFFYRPGKTPILLVAHVDTVHRTPPREIFYDRKQQVMWSPDGLGADDRAGVLGVMWLIQAGFSPHVLLTDGEESGGTGAKEATKILPKPNVRYLIQLDRKNGNEAVFYNCDNPAFTKYIEETGYITTTGIFSDICVLCPHWQIAGVNLSCGYYENHTNREYLKLNDLRHTVTKVKHLLQNVPSKTFKYIPATTTHYQDYGWWRKTPAKGHRWLRHYRDYLERCDICGSYTETSELKVKDKILYCSMCWDFNKDEKTCTICYKTKPSSYFLYNKDGEDICIGCWNNC